MYPAMWRSLESNVVKLGKGFRSTRRSEEVFNFHSFESFETRLSMAVSILFGNIQIFLLEPPTMRRVGCAIEPFFSADSIEQASFTLAITAWAIIADESWSRSRRIKKRITRCPFQDASRRNWCLRWVFSLSFSLSFIASPWFLRAYAS